MSASKLNPPDHPLHDPEHDAFRTIPPRSDYLDAQYWIGMQQPFILVLCDQCSCAEPEVPPGPLDDRETKSKIDKEFVSIAIPAFIQFASEPLASLVNTMYLGRLGAVALGAAGIAISAQYSVSKLYNDPLLRTSISLVELSNRVSAALLLAFCIGIIQAAVFGLFSERIIELMGVSRSAEMFLPAIAFLKVKSLGAPGMTLWLVSNGIFRGLGDTVTPLKWASIFTLLNAVLDPFFIFTLNLGCPGAAMGTVAAQYIAVIPLLLKLHEKFHLQFSLSSLRSSLTSYLSSGSFVFIRTIGKVLTYFVCSREAALLGTVSSAAYNICFQLGTATTQICESISVASQSILARESTKDDVRSLFTFLNQRHVLQGLTTDASVQAAAATIMPLVLWTQVSKGMAYPVNGMIMGAMDWKFLSASM
ncbi:hypothetical protein GUITHDRAFT_118868 [Guillardia theta CCMP2712]|uniref:Polysaccharide biosynthesis protein C-terminal domain-containing protein n=1 Tax=Guillardia theta (strain CCMP2712) TaxID=905079 RepID=L1IG88_GUITC|nr:hypothetical protein GUITHDRAFT_118868 [Guillardia theta CCMP2712]EKX34934.1 hypothetical protein GUITHDRAFT_118868 [Guillardia theta CCMP2712]|eukprot:XP_005821914.1 hypothetical protein GUITHDRAFT_118868 [Guillardia theta CCMP2712]